MGKLVVVVLGCVILAGCFRPPPSSSVRVYRGDNWETVEETRRRLPDGGEARTRVRARSPWLNIQGNGAQSLRVREEKEGEKFEMEYIVPSPYEYGGWRRGSMYRGTTRRYRGKYYWNEPDYWN